MLKQTIQFKDVDGNPIEEDFYFHLSKAELTKMELSHEDGFVDHLKKVAESNNGKLIVETFEDIILNSVGKRSDDGRRFIKNNEIREDFKNSDAYSELFMSLVTDAGEAAKFVNGVVPAELVQELSKGGRVTDLQLPDEAPAWITENREPTQDEVRTMTPEQLREAFQRKTSS